MAHNELHDYEKALATLRQAKMVNEHSGTTLKNIEAELKELGGKMSAGSERIRKIDSDAQNLRNGIRQYSEHMNNLQKLIPEGSEATFKGKIEAQINDDKVEIDKKAAAIEKLEAEKGKLFEERSAQDIAYGSLMKERGRILEIAKNAEEEIKKIEEKYASEEELVAKIGAIRGPKEVAVAEKFVAEEPVEVPVESEIISNYVKLLRAKEKWRNRFKSEKIRKILGVSGDRNILLMEQGVRTEFAGLVQRKVADAEDNAKAVEEILTTVGQKLNKDKQKFVRMLRKPSVALARFAIGAALATAAIHTGGVSALVCWGGASAVAGMGRFLAVDGLWDYAHYKMSKAKKNASHIANIFYNKLDAAQISKSAKELVENGTDGIGNRIESGMVEYAGKLAKQRFWKRVAAIGAVVAPCAGAIGAWLGMKPEVVPTAPVPKVVPKMPIPEAVPAPQAVPELPAAPVQPPVVAPSPVVHEYVAAKGKGIWHIARKAAAKGISGFEHLSAKDQKTVVDAMKDYIIAQPGEVGLDQNEMIARPIEKGGPWLRKGAKLVIGDDDISSAMKRLPKRIIDTLGMGANSPSGAGMMKKAMQNATSHFAKAKVA